MKRIIFAVVLAISAFASAPAAQAAPAANSNPVERIWRSLPDVMVVKQTATLSDGRSVTLYYRKAGDQCEVYTPSDLKGLRPEDVMNIEKSDFAIARSAEGRKVYNAPISKVRRIIKQAVINYL